MLLYYYYNAGFERVSIDETYKEHRNFFLEYSILDFIINKMPIISNRGDEFEDFNNHYEVVFGEKVKCTDVYLPNVCKEKVVEILDTDNSDSGEESQDEDINKNTLETIKEEQEEEEQDNTNENDNKNIGNENILSESDNEQSNYADNEDNSDEESNSSNDNSQSGGISGIQFGQNKLTNALNPMQVVNPFSGLTRNNIQIMNDKKSNLSFYVNVHLTLSPGDAKVSNLDKPGLACESSGQEIRRNWAKITGKTYFPTPRKDEDIVFHMKDKKKNDDKNK